MGNTGVGNRLEAHVLEEGSGEGRARLHRQHLVMVMREGGNGLKQRTGQALMPAGRQDIQPANSSGPAESGLLLTVEAAYRDHGAVNQVREQDLARQVEAIGACAEIGQQSADHAMALAGAGGENLRPVVAIN
jgi:hypothetical protein